MGFGNLGIGQWGSGDSGLDFPFFEEGGYTEWDSDTGETTYGTVGDSGWGGTNFLGDFTKVDHLLVHLLLTVVEVY